MEYNQDWVEEDELLGPQKRTTHVIHGILNSIREYLVFTTEDQEDYSERKLPTLDCRLWVEQGVILYDFYEKPQVPNRTLQNGTALARTGLEASLIQEGVRRLINTSPLVPCDVRTEIIDKFAKKLVNSEFDTYTVQRILVSAVSCFLEKVRKSKLDHSDEEYQPLFLSKNYNKADRLLTKGSAKCSWYTSRNKKTWWMEDDFAERMEAQNYQTKKN